VSLNILVDITLPYLLSIASNFCRIQFFFRFLRVYEALQGNGLLRLEFPFFENSHWGKPSTPLSNQNNIENGKDKKKLT